jgi:hypothetical protein
MKDAGPVKLRVERAGKGFVRRWSGASHLIALSAEVCTNLDWIEISIQKARALRKGKHGDAALTKMGKWVRLMSQAAASVLSRVDF